MFVCLWSPTWRTAADSLADLSPALLTVAPRVVTEERRGGLVWVDARGLDAERVAREALDVLLKLGLSNVRVGIGRTAIVAEVAAVEEGGGRREAGGTTSGGPAMGSILGGGALAFRLPPPACPISILEPDPALATLLEGIGVETCGDLAALEGESVEVR